MSRVLKMMSIAVVLFLAYMWISVLTKSCNRDREEQVKLPEPTQNGDEFASDDFFTEEGDTSTVKTDDPVDYTEIDETIQKTVEKTKTGSPTSKETDDAAPTVPIKQNNGQTNVNNTKAVEKPSPSPETKKTPSEKPVLKPKVPAIKQAPADEIKKTEKMPIPVKKATGTGTAAESGGSGGYIVVAGNYLVEANANVMLQKLKKAGFTGAETVVFDLSEFHTVIAGRYEKQETAVKTINNLKSKGIDAYLHRKK